MIVDSSIWDEPDFVCKVFVTMLALKDCDDIYRGTAYQLATRSRKTEVEVLEALRILSSPDTRRVEKQEHEGRRIKLVEEGWLVLNGAKYRDMMREEMKRARWRRAQKKQREKEVLKTMKQNPLPGEQNYNKAADNGWIDESGQFIRTDKECPL